jgi:hypothetical protein
VQSVALHVVCACVDWFGGCKGQSPMSRVPAVVQLSSKFVSFRSVANEVSCQRCQGKRRLRGMGVSVRESSTVQHAALGFFLGFVFQDAA